MKCHNKVLAFVLAFFAFTWLIPPEYLISPFLSNNIPVVKAVPVVEIAKDLETTEDGSVVAAARLANSSETNMMLEQYTIDSSSIVGELVERRDMFTKYFRMEDGTFQAVMYDSAVNYQKSDGTWAEVDNTLTAATDKAGSTTYKTRDNGYLNVAFAGNSTDDELVSLKKGEYTLSWKLTQGKALISETTEPELAETPEPSPSETIPPQDPPEPSTIPEPTATPEPIATPEPTVTPEPEEPLSETTEAAVPEATDALETTESILDENPAYKTTTNPVETDNPETSIANEITETSAPTATPEQTSSPAATTTSASTAPRATSSATPLAERSTQVLSVNAAVINDRAKMRAALKGNDLKRAADKVKSHIQYAGVMQGVDLDYIVEPQGVKELITLYEYIPDYAISFDVSAPGLTLKEIEGGITAFCDGKTEVFFLMPSYMTDSGDRESSVKTTIESSKKGYRLTLTPDDAWLKSATYPVVIDPRFDVDWDKNNVDDTYIASEYPNGQNNDGTNGSWYSYAEVRLGYSSDYGTIYSLVKYTDLPPLRSSEAVIGAAMRIMRTNDGSTTTDQYTLHRITSSWSQTQVTWNTRPSYSSIAEEAHTISNANGPANYFYDWNITNLVRGWYTGEFTNYGFLIKGESTDSGYRKFHSSDAIYLDDAVKTVIQYMNTAGIEDHWSYQTMDVRRAGTASVNLFTGNLVVSRSDIGTDGNRVPISISHVYNAVYKDDDNNGYGMGWRLNYAQTVTKETISGKVYYKYIDGDGTAHYFEQSGSNYIDESGMNRIFKLDEIIDDIDSGSGVAYNYSIRDKDDNVLCFDAFGRLVKVRDPLGNYASITYTSDTKNRIKTITDGAGRVYTFNYDAATHDLKSIAAPGGRAVSFDYDASHRLIDITDPDGGKSIYTYNTSGEKNNTISNLQSNDGYNLTVLYTSSTRMLPKVSDLKEWGNAAKTVQGGVQTFTYNEKETKVVDHLGNVNLYQFNQYGNTVTIQDDEGRAVYAHYYSPDSATDDGGKYGHNKMSLSSRLEEPVMNSVLDHSFENNRSWTSGSTPSGLTDNIVRSSNYMVHGKYSAKLENTDNTAYLYKYQYIDVVKGATYVLSAWVKTSSIVPDGDGGAFIQARYVQASGAETSVSSQKLTGTNDWTRMSVRFTVPSDAGSTQVRVWVRSSLCTGSAWFDAVQLERSTAVNRYNLVENGDMSVVSGDVPSYWTKSAESTSNDVATMTSDTGRGLLDNKVYKITGNLTRDKSLSQTIMVSGSAGDAFSYGGWAKANCIPLGTYIPYPDGKTTYGRKFAIRLELKNGSTDAGSRTSSFNDFSNLWQYLSDRVLATGTYDRAIITLLYENEDNNAFFDGIQLYKEEFGQIYKYDKKGNIITTKDLNSQSSDITYDSSNNPLTLQPPDCSDSEKYTATYYTGFKKHLVDTSTTVMGVKTKYVYDSYGNTTSAEVRDNLTTPTAFIRTQAEYTTGGNYIKKSFDPRGKASESNYSTNYGVNLSTMDPSGHTVSYTYDGGNAAIKMGKLTRVSATASGKEYVNNYSYTHDLLTKINHNGFDYTMAYNLFAQLTSVSVGGQNLVTNTYITGDRSYLLDYLTYGNGGKVDYTYDSRYRVSAVKYDNESAPRYSYTYGANGQLATVQDTQNGLTSTIHYDTMERPMKYVEAYSGLTRTFQYAYDIDNCLTQFLELFGTTQYKTNLTYDKDNRITKVNYGNAAGSENVRYTYDVLGRLQKRTLETGTSDYVLTYSYLAGGYGTGSTTGTVSGISYNGASSLVYTYDSCGRIASVSDGTKIVRYVYDGLGQLIRTDDPTDPSGGTGGSTWAYSYDAGGNILSKKLYAHCYGDNDLTDNTVVDSIAYAYDAAWKDKLTSYDGKAITYDQIGNPLTYDGWNYIWEAGRQLKQMSKSGTTLQFRYNDAGLRTQKINGSATTKYYWAGNNISHMTSGSNTLHFWYDAAGLPSMVTYNNTKYYYKHNQQGDIIGLLDMNGSEVVSYTYDSWGKQLSCTGSLASTLGAVNPLRYRGYIWDAETGLYYLQSRYYNPEWGRFANTDGIIPSKGDPLEYNIFSYCINDPVNRRDNAGYSWQSALATTCLVVGLVAIGAAAIAITVGTGGVGAAPALAGAYAASSALAASTIIAEGAVGFGVAALATGTVLAVMPDRQIAKDSRGKIEHNYPNDHKPAHAHVTDKNGGNLVRIGQNGKPLKGEPELTVQQSRLVKDNLNQVRKVLGKVMKYFRME